MIFSSIRVFSVVQFFKAKNQIPITKDHFEQQETKNTPLKITPPAKPSPSDTHSQGGKYSQGDLPVDAIDVRLELFFPH